MAKDMWTKICGVTTLESAHAVINAGVSAVGLNFFSGSKRFVSVSAAAEIANVIRTQGPTASAPDIVGVFVNSQVADIARTADEVGLTAIQFHGDETLDLICRLHEARPALSIIRALRVSLERLDEHLRTIDDLQQRVPLAACLLDAFVAGEFGGTGMTIDLRIPAVYLQRTRPRLILAGGLTPENVANIVEQANPWGVDTASGVETAPGIKHPDRCTMFVREASKLREISGQRLASR
jgi:phosphoribosylanthranilate isomerase